MMMKKMVKVNMCVVLNVDVDVDVDVFVIIVNCFMIDDGIVYVCVWMCFDVM